MNKPRQTSITPQGSYEDRLRQIFFVLIQQALRPLRRILGMNQEYMGHLIEIERRNSEILRIKSSRMLTEFN